MKNLRKVLIHLAISLLVSISCDTKTKDITDINKVKFTDYYFDVDIFTLNNSYAHYYCNNDSLLKRFSYSFKDYNEDYFISFMNEKDIYILNNKDTFFLKFIGKANFKIDNNLYFDSIDVYKYNYYFSFHKNINYYFTKEHGLILKINNDSYWKCYLDSSSNNKFDRFNKLYLILPDAF